METTLVQERGRIDAGGVGWIIVWRAIARSVMAMQVAACSVQARSVLAINHHAVGAVPASTSDGGIKFGHCTAGPGDARLVGAFHVLASVFVAAVRYGASRRRHSSNPGDAVLDPFAGSGTTVAVAKRMGREATGIELNPAYAEIAERRLEVVA